MTAASDTRSVTPIDLTITPRDRRFGRDDATPRLWHGGESRRPRSTMPCRRPSRSAKPFSSRACARFATGPIPKLADDIRTFTTQEVVHSREHLAFNRRAADSGYDLTKLEAQVEKRLALTRSKPTIVSLAATMALEHFTAILAHELLADSAASRRERTGDAPICGNGTRPRRSSIRASPSTPGLHATRDWTRAKRWKVKALVMLYVTRNFVVDRTAGALELLRQDGIDRAARVGQAGSATRWFSPGMMRKIFAAWVAYLPARLPPVVRSTIAR